VHFFSLFRCRHVFFIAFYDFLKKIISPGRFYFFSLRLFFIE
jgi:hypothetical protein